MEVIICPGFTKLYRVALVDDAGSFQALSEHDDPYRATAAKLIANAAKDRADLLLNKIFRETAK